MAEPARNHIAFFDGLRGIAVLIVVAYHLHERGVMPDPTPLFGTFAALLPVAQRSDGDAICGGKSLLSQAEAIAELFHVGNVNETGQIEKTDRRCIGIIANRGFNLRVCERLDGSPVRIRLNGRITGFMIDPNHIVQFHHPLYSTATP